MTRKDDTNEITKAIRAQIAKDVAEAIAARDGRIAALEQAVTELDIEVNALRVQLAATAST